MYYTIQYMIYRLFQNIEIQKIKDFIFSILDNSSIKNLIKNIIIAPMIDFIINYTTLLVENIDNDYPEINLDNLCQFDKCLGDNCQLVKNIELLSINKSRYLWNSIIYLNSKFEDNVYLKEVLYRLKLKITDDEGNKQNIIEYIIKFLGKNNTYLDDAILQYNYLVSKLKNEYCKFKIILSNQRFKILKRHILEDIVRNSHMRHLLFNSFRVSSKGTKFKHYPNELIIMDKELSDKNIITNLYQTIRKSYYQTFIHFDEIEHKKLSLELTNIVPESDKSIDICYCSNYGNHTLTVEPYYEKYLINNSDKTNFKKLSLKEYKDITVSIFSKNIIIGSINASGPHSFNYKFLFDNFDHNILKQLN